MLKSIFFSRKDPEATVRKKELTKSPRIKIEIVTDSEVAAVHENQVVVIDPGIKILIFLTIFTKLLYIFNFKEIAANPERRNARNAVAQNKNALVHLRMKASKVAQLLLDQ